jgi:hypothetical protein
MMHIYLYLLIALIKPIIVDMHRDEKSSQNHVTQRNYLLFF